MKQSAPDAVLIVVFLAVIGLIVWHFAGWQAALAIVGVCAAAGLFQVFVRLG